MDVWILLARGTWPLVGLALLLACLGGSVAQGAATRVTTSLGLESNAWRLVLALALGSAVWSAHMVMVSARGPSFPVGYSVFGALATGAIAFLLSAFTVWIMGLPKMTPPRAGLAVVVFSLGLLLTSYLGVNAIGLAAEANWQVAGVLLSIGVTGVGVTATLLCAYEQQKRKKLGWWPQINVSCLLGFTVVLSHFVMLSAVEWGEVTRIDSHPLSGSTLTALASAGSLVLLVALWLGLKIEAHLRASLLHANGQLERNAQTDTLTGLSNRLRFEAELMQAAHKADDLRCKLALLFIDLDGFKPINEVFGHHGGDQVLREVSSRLRSLVGPHDRLGRLGADEFLLLLTQDPSEELAAAFAQKVVNLLSTPCKLQNREAMVSCSIGVAMYPSHGAASALIAHADLAMRASKAVGGAAFSIFEACMMSDVREQVELLQDLRHALAQKQFELLYQLKINAPSCEITGAEALLRWRHPKRGVIGPMVFIPLAERFGLINAIGAWVIEESCRQIHAWQKEGLRMRLSVNLSVHQLRQLDLPDRIAETLKRYQIQPDLLTCEITESVALDDEQSTIVLFEKLAAVGVHISIDDFGTGYSSLSYLRKLPASELKIDRSFVLDLEGSSDARTLVEAVIKMAQALSLRVVAEGVETEAQHQILRALGCDILQGFLFAKPMTAQALILWAMMDGGPQHIDFRRSLIDPEAPELG